MPVLHVAEERAPESLATAYRRVREQSERLCQPLQPEDFGLQAVPETSPPKWHLAHTSWFFETFLLKPFLRAYEPVHPAYERLFNSYYNGIGEPFPRPWRGLLSRPSLDEVMEYRRHVDRHVLELLAGDSAGQDGEIADRVTLGLHHEQQHQELFFTDLKYSFSCNPLYPAYQACEQGGPRRGPSEWHWHEHEGGLVTLGAEGDTFCFDNETPRHRVFLEPFALASRPVNNAEYLAFIEDGGYRRPELWLADGWTWLQQDGHSAPLYWVEQDGQWWEFTLYGLRPLDPAEPVCHVSAYEADAYARWAGARLPSEFEWEAMARSLPAGARAGQFIDSGLLHPGAAMAGRQLQQMFGTVWEWTCSAYGPYPGYRARAGALGEYNGKFMCNQLVLRGGSCVSSAEHIRTTYRNFFYPPHRWQFSGIRLARSLPAPPDSD